VTRGEWPCVALKLAESVKVCGHYYQKEDQAKATLEKLRAFRSDVFVLQADVCSPKKFAACLRASNQSSSFGHLRE